MRNVLIAASAALCLVVVAPVAANKGTGATPAISAKLAASRLPTPSFDELHRQYMRVSLHESGWKSLADQNGILESMLFGAGGRRMGRPEGRGVGYGIIYSRLMTRMVRHSGRTFPRDSRFLDALSPGKLVRISKLRTRRNEWVSDLQLDCSEPRSWNMSTQGEWLGYVKRCARLRETTAAFLKGELENHCDGAPTTWGSHEDTYRPGGPVSQGWDEIRCDWPFRTIEVEGEEIASCEELRAASLKNPEAKRVLLNSTSCGRNRFWTWVKRTGGDGLAMR